MKSGLTRVIAKSPLFADKLWMVVAWHIASDGKKQKTKCFREKKDPEIVGRRKREQHTEVHTTAKPRTVVRF